MRVLIYEERPDVLDYIFERAVIDGYRVGIAKEGSEILDMLSDGRYDIVLTNADVKKLTLVAST